MSRKGRVLATLGVLLALGAAVAAYELSHDDPCKAAAPPPAGAATMKAIVRRCYGPPEVLSLENIAMPAPTEHRVVVKVHAASLNPLDRYYTRGVPYLMRLDAGIGHPKEPRLGVDYAGTVVAAGVGVTRFRVGDKVFGGKQGALAEYVSVLETGPVVPKPGNLTFEQAAAIPVAAVTALQALRDKAAVKPGQRVLINGASGGVGTFAVQIARALGAEVTGVCSTGNVEMVRSLGAQHVIDYTREDFTTAAERYDVVIDNVGNRSLGEIRRVMKPDGRYVVTGGRSHDRWLGPVARMVGVYLRSPFISQDVVFFVADLKKDDLAYLAGLAQSGKLTPVIDRRYPLAEVPAALSYLETGHARAKVVIDVSQANET
jgi:NADPH:quinone reductase-like Zn-dependent oxidoreductase